MKTIDEDIRSGNLKQIYLLYGTEDYLKRQYRDKLKNALTAAGEDSGMGGMLSGGDSDMNFNRFEGKDINPKQVIDLAETLPFFAERRVILIENSGFFKNACDELAEYLAQPAASTYFVFVEEEVDKRSKMYKAVKNAGKIVEFATQTEELITRWVLARLKKEGKNITGSVMQLFLSKTGSDMGNIDRELEKLICYCLDRDVVTAEDVEAVCTTRITNHIFDMVNAIAEKQPQKALQLYYDLLALKEPPMRVLFLIARQCNLLLQTKELKSRGHDNKTIASKIGVPPFAAGKYVAQASHFKTSVLKNAVKQCVETEEAVKSGRMNDMMSVEILILSVLPS